MKRLWIVEKHDGRPCAKIWAYSIRQAREIYENPILDVLIENVTPNGIIGEIPPRRTAFVRIRLARPDEI